MLCDSNNSSIKKMRNIEKDIKPLIFSGIQPTRNLQLGNYLGVIKKWIHLQENYDCMYCVADMHALTINSSPEELRSNTREITATFLASGIDPRKNIVFNQSRVFQHSELSWIFNCLTQVGYMYRMTQFKDKSKKNPQKASMGLLAYPILMASDILLYRATHVPVGEDQLMHIELTRNIAKKFNTLFSDQILYFNIKNKKNNVFFPIVKPILDDISMRIMSLRDGKKKMSKSDFCDFSRINLSDTEEEISKKIKKAKTDSYPIPEQIEDLIIRPEADNLIRIYASLKNVTRENVLLEFGGKSFEEFKKDLTELIIHVISPIRNELNHLKKDTIYIDNVLKEGAKRASCIAEKTMKYVREIIGFL